MCEIALANGGVAFVDDVDFRRVAGHRWKDFGGRAVSSIEGRTVSMHRFILRASPDSTIDHVNRNPLDNRRANLRFCTPVENQRNRGPHKNSKSGIKGVSFDPVRRRWRASIKCDGKNISIGYFLSNVDAAHAYNTRARELFGAFAVTNRIDKIEERREIGFDRVAHMTRERHFGNGVSGYRGVYPWRKRWAAVLSFREKGKRHRRCIGVFDKPEDAARAWNVAARETWGDSVFQNGVT